MAQGGCALTVPSSPWPLNIDGWQASRSFFGSLLLLVAFALRVWPYSLPSARLANLLLLVVFLRVDESPLFQVLLVLLWRQIFPIHVQRWPHYRDNRLNVLDIVGVELLDVDFLRLEPLIDPERHEVAVALDLLDWSLRWNGLLECWAAQLDRRSVLILLAELNLAYLVTHVFGALLLQIPHEVCIDVEFLEEKVLFNAVELAFHAQTDARGDMGFALRHNMVLAADHTALTQSGDLIHAVLFARGFGAHRLALAGQLARRFLGLFQHFRWVQSLQLSTHAETHLAREETFLHDVDVLEGVVLVEDCRALDASEHLEGVTDVLELLLGKGVEVGAGDLLQKVHLIVLDPFFLQIDHLCHLRLG